VEYPFGILRGIGLGERRTLFVGTGADEGRNNQVHGQKEKIGRSTGVWISE
jgi:hypothetical protein